MCCRELQLLWRVCVLLCRWPIIRPCSYHPVDMRFLCCRGSPRHPSADHIRCQAVRVIATLSAHQYPDPDFCLLFRSGKLAAYFVGNFNSVICHWCKSYVIPETQATDSCAFIHLQGWLCSSVTMPFPVSLMCCPRLWRRRGQVNRLPAPSVSQTVLLISLTLTLPSHSSAFVFRVLN